MILLVLMLLSWPCLATATTYYVSTAGNNSNNGTSTGTAWRSPQKCAQPPVAAGDTCIIRDGTYTAADSSQSRFVILISSSVSSASGTSTNPITIKAENYGGAVFVQPTDSTSTTTIDVNRPWYIIEGIEIDGSTTIYNTGSSTSHAGIAVHAGNTVLRRNYIHDIARTLCSTSSFGNSGIITATGLSNILIERNLIHTIGRLRNGENGCSTPIFQHDHGIYITWGTDITIRNNVIYDANRGFCLNIFSSSTSVHTRYRIHNNTFAGRSPTGAPSGQIITGGQWIDGQIINNLFYQVDIDLAIAQFNLQSSSSGNVVSYNHTNVDLPGSSPLFGGSTPPGFTYSNNTENDPIAFTNASCTQSDGGCENHDFTLAAGSSAINAGTDVGLACNGVCDQGAFETFTFASCQVPSGAAGTIQVTFTSNANLLGTTLTTFTARRNGSANALTGAASKIGDTIISLPVTTTYVGGNTVDISWSSGGLSDAALIGGILNQPFVQTLSNQSCTNNVGGVLYTFTQATYLFHGVYGLEASPDIRSIEGVSSFSVVKNGAVRLRFALVCSGADCPPSGFYLYYATGGSYVPVPDVYGVDNIAFCGEAYSNGPRPENGAATTNQLSTAGTFTPGGVVYSANAIPTITGFNTNYKTELEYCVRFNSSASGAYTFRVYQQDGTALNTYTLTPIVTILAPQASGAF